MDALEGSYIATSSEYVYASDIIATPLGNVVHTQLRSSVLQESQDSIPPTTGPRIEELSDGTDHVEGSEDNVIQLCQPGQYMALSESDVV